MRKLSASFLIATLALTACQVGRQVKDMHDSTVQMNKTTTDMDTSMNEMKDKTNHLSQTSDALKTLTLGLHDDLIQCDSLDSRRKALAIMLASKDSSFQFSQAAAYFMGFEFQFWTPDFDPKGGDYQRQYWASLAVQEFFASYHAFVPPGDETPHPLTQPDGKIDGKKNKISVANSLAATLEYMDRRQMTLLQENPEIKPLTMYSMIETSLLMENDLHTGKIKEADAPLYVKEVLAQKKEALYLLQARYNYLATMVLAQITNIADGTWSAKYTAAKIRFLSWDMDVASLNVGQLSYLNRFMKDSLAARDLLVKLGQKPVLDNFVAKAYGNLNITSSATTAQDAGIIGASQLLVQQINNLKQEN